MSFTCAPVVSVLIPSAAALTRDARMAIGCGVRVRWAGRSISNCVGNGATALRTTLDLYLIEVDGGNGTPEGVKILEEMHN